MRIVEPPIIGVEMDLCVFGLFVTISKGGIGSSMSDVFPFTCNRELSPSAWEDFADIDLVVVLFPVFVIHPPVTIIFELVIQFFSEFKLVIPSLIFITETTIPLSRSWTPWITNVEKLKLLCGSDILHAQKTIGVIKCDTVWTCTLFSLAIFVFH